MFSSLIMNSFSWKLIFVLFEHNFDPERWVLQFLRAHEPLSGLNWIGRGLFICGPAPEYPTPAL